MGFQVKLIFFTVDGGIDEVQTVREDFLKWKTRENELVFFSMKTELRSDGVKLITCGM